MNWIEVPSLPRIHGAYFPLSNTNQIPNLTLLSLSSSSQCQWKLQAPTLSSPTSPPENSSEVYCTSLSLSLSLKLHNIFSFSFAVSQFQNDIVWTDSSPASMKLVSSPYSTTPRTPFPSLSPSARYLTLSL